MAGLTGIAGSLADLGAGRPERAGGAPAAGGTSGPAAPGATAGSTFAALLAGALVPPGAPGADPGDDPGDHPRAGEGADPAAPPADDAHAAPGAAVLPRWVDVRRLPDAALPDAPADTTPPAGPAAVQVPATTDPADAADEAEAEAAVEAAAARAGDLETAWPTSAPTDTPVDRPAGAPTPGTPTPGTPTVGASAAASAPEAPRISRPAAAVTRALRDPGLLAPELRARLGRVVERMRDEFGHAVAVAESGRTQARQEHLFAQGRTRPGPVVTWTRSSEHTRGRAVDVTIDGGYDDAAAFRLLQQVAREEGLHTLGARDPGHLQLPAGVAGTGPAALLTAALPEGATFAPMTAAPEAAPEWRTRVESASVRTEWAPPAAAGGVPPVAAVARVADVATVAPVATVATPGAATPPATNAPGTPADALAAPPGAARRTASPAAHRPRAARPPAATHVAGPPTAGPTIPASPATSPASAPPAGAPVPGEAVAPAGVGGRRPTARAADAPPPAGAPTEGDLDPAASGSPGSGDRAVGGRGAGADASAGGSGGHGHGRDDDADGAPAPDAFEVRRMPRRPAPTAGTASPDVAIDGALRATAPAALPATAAAPAAAVLGPVAAQRVADVLAAQERGGARQLSHLTLRVENAAGGEDRIRVDLRTGAGGPPRSAPGSTWPTSAPPTASPAAPASCATRSPGTG
jgi:hypothetical protein